MCMSYYCYTCNVSKFCRSLAGWPWCTKAKKKPPQFFWPHKGFSSQAKVKQNKLKRCVWLHYYTCEQDAVVREYQDS